MQEDIFKAVECLRAGRLVGLPTETVYGLAANALDDRAVASIYAAKGRPSFNPLIIHVADAAAAKAHAQWNADAEKLAAAFWPGPLTLVLPRAQDCTISLLASAGLDTVALRVPAHPIAQAVLQESGLPLAAPSANRSGRISPTSSAHVREELGDVVSMVLDGGPCQVGLESTIVHVASDVPMILRPGAITREMLQAVLGKTVCIYKGEDVHAPGMLASHYAPSIPVRLNVHELQPGEALLAFGQPLVGAALTLNLSAKKDLTEAAANLFAHLRALDNPAYSAIAVMPIPAEGLGIAINDRLSRAAAER